jgi:hypothetical protein
VRILRYVFILSAVLAGCKKEDGLGPFSFLNGKSITTNPNGQQAVPFGIYKLLNYEDTVYCPYEVVLEIKNEHNSKGEYIVNGKSAVNFYFAGLEASIPSDSISVLGLSSTKIVGSIAQLKFEKDYLNRLEASDSYVVQDNGKRLILKMPIKYMVFVKK